METVRVIYHHEADGWWAESPDVEGWSAAGDSYPESSSSPKRAFRSPWSATPTWSTSFPLASTSQRSRNHGRCSWSTTHLLSTDGLS